MTAPAAHSAAPPPFLTKTKELQDFCARALSDNTPEGGFVTVDTEFHREKSYYPKLCLVQIGSAQEAVLVDPLAKSMDLSALKPLFTAPGIVKVFHSGRQDIEIFLQMLGLIPNPLFDTQIAAMVCGFGDSVSYEKLVIALTGASVDKHLRATDWTKRPLSQAQAAYALGDVTYLRTVYSALSRRIADQNREEWVAEEMAALSDEAGYRQNPREVWRRLRLKNRKPRFLAILRELAAWREEEAMKRDIPRGHVIKDETLIEVAASAPATPEELAGNRNLSAKWVKTHGDAVLAAIAAGKAVPQEDYPRMPAPPPLPEGVGPLVELLKVLLKRQSELHQVAPRLIADADDLEKMAAFDAPDVQALSGWRFDIFGKYALELKSGKAALTARGSQIELIQVG
ncbi:MAG: ribonuclease D [Alphaproteobacteria bacterium]|nr:ribonuclease D [Alphaproteobacteria bacterium]